MTRLLCPRLGMLCAVAVSIPASAVLAQNPDWPNPDATREDMTDPANWPDDPSWGYDVNGDDPTCIPGGRCWDGLVSGGDWTFWSWVPPGVLAEPGFRAAEESLGSGTWADMAWTRTTGDRRVVIAVLDSGIRWHHPDLTNKFLINRGELEVDGLDARCLPQPPAGHAGDPVDVDGDGILSMRDWFAGKGEAVATALRTEIDSMGNGNGVAEPGDLIVLCSDGADDDGNGYIDDVSGWDFHHDDNDPADDTSFGHGTGEARLSGAEGNDGIGDIGHCPDCRLLMVRVGDSFVVDVQDYAQGVVFAVDSGAHVVQEALGSVNHTTFMRRANRYAYESGALVVASAADENSRHHNFPGTANHTLYVHAVRYAGSNPQNSESYLAFNNCTNYGAQLVLSAPGTGCSSEATGVTAGVAGLVYSAAMSESRPGGPLDPPLQAEEVRQLLLMNADDIDVPESRPDHPDFDDRWYPSREGWDQRFGYGRVNAFHAVDAVWAGRIPPEVNVVHPDWFRVVYPDRTPTVSIQGRVAADRASGFDYVVEWAPGVEPGDADFEELASGSGDAPIEGELVSWDVSGLEIDNDGEVENRYTVTVRVRATAHYGGAVGDVVAEQRRAIAIHRDPSLLPGFPVALGVRHGGDIFPAASGEGSPKMADLDGDGDVEIVYADADGLLHVFQEDGSELDGYPVALARPLRGFDPADPNHIRGSEAYATESVPIDDVRSSLIATPALGDLDGDGVLEIVAASLEGDVFAVHAPDGTPVDGWPVGLPEVLSGDTLRSGPTSRDHVVERGIFASPALADLDGDGELEVVVAAFDGHVYAFRADGSSQPGFPVEVTAPVLWEQPEDARPGRIMTSPAVGDVNGDGLPDIVTGSSEVGFQGNTGAFHVLHGDGTEHEGGAQHDHWPATVSSVSLLPLVGEGTVSAAALADVTSDGRPELLLTGTANPMFAVDGIQQERPVGERIPRIWTVNTAVPGPLASEALDRTDVPLFSTFANGAFGDLDADGVPDFVTGGAGPRLALNLAGGWQNTPFNHQVGAWSGIDGSYLPGYPRVIEDYMFFVNPSVVDVNGDGYPEVVTGSGGYYVHAWDACGREAAGWPKFVGGWVTASVALGDVDGDDLLEAAVTTRNGYLFVFETEGPAEGAIGWPEFRHDNHNTGNYEAPLPNGGSRVAADEPIDCPTPVAPDAGPDGGGDAGADAGTGDAGVSMGDAGPGDGGGDGGCCAVVPRRERSGPAFLALGLVVAVLLRRRGRCSR